MMSSSSKSPNDISRLLCLLVQRETVPFTSIYLKFIVFFSDSDFLQSPISTNIIRQNSFLFVTLQTELFVWVNINYFNSRFWLLVNFQNATRSFLLVYVYCVIHVIIITPRGSYFYHFLWILDIFTSPHGKDCCFKK